VVSLRGVHDDVLLSPRAGTPDDTGERESSRRDRQLSNRAAATGITRYQGIVRFV
jgi:hypothetical protein